MKKGIKRALCICLLAVCVVLLGGFAFSGRDPEQAAAKLVQTNRAELEALVESTIRTGTVQDAAPLKGYQIHYWEDQNMVEFTKGSGFGSSTAYYGLYYSPSDIPLGYQGTSVAFSQEGDGWVWHEENGDNWEYTKKIADHWYWFEMHF